VSVPASARRWNPGRAPEPHGRWDALWLFLAAFTVYALTSPGATAYDQYARFADAVLHGSLSLPHRPPHLEMAEYQGRAYFSNPPTPAILLLPIVWLAEHPPLRDLLVRWSGGWGVPLGALQTFLSLLLGALSVALARIALGRVPVSRRAANWGAALFGFGTIHWYHATIGSVWYVAQIAHATMMWLLVCEWLGRARALLLGLWFAAAFWCRMETAVAAPFILVARPDRWLLPLADEVLPRVRLSWLIRFAIPIAAVIALNGAYNWVRFGVVTNWAYEMLIEKPEVRGLFPHGLMSWQYWPGHVYVLFRAKPIFQHEFPWVLPSVGGLAIWATTPAFVYALRAPLDRLTAGCWVGILLFVFALFQFGGTGMTQLGYRFAMDFYPLLVLLTIRGMDRPLRWWHAALIAFCIALNAWWVWVLNILRIQRLF
jgi:hypothetical protein